ncbi:MAG: cupin domain-containing protein [Anaeromusa sp.]|uniref:cupin domain-containing protein n=1 Tax=Anaeromusa sp. TaxID=1872520 RepID=UPI002A0A416D|nr:cupin domain-containing protein [Anaeromusa sp.]MEA4835556.1 cupin domain-containing protein [Anaeromusa sp.]
MSDLSNSVIFPKGNKMPEPYNKYFVGQAYLEMLVPGDKEFNCPIGNVTFEPGCRNNWHKHPGGQILLVTGGRGWYQEEGKTACEIKAGDVVKIAANVKHWHGAAIDSWLAHLSVETNSQAGSAEWLEPITDDEYNKLNSKN